MTDGADWQVTINSADPIRMRVSDMRRISEITGKSWSDLFSGTDEADRFQVMVFWKLRQGNREVGAEELWKIAADAEFTLETPPPDPSGAVS
jgi:hypothetical protein